MFNTMQDGTVQEGRMQVKSRPCMRNPLQRAELIQHAAQGPDVRLEGVGLVGADLGSPGAAAVSAAVSAAAEIRFW